MPNSKSKTKSKSKRQRKTKAKSTKAKTSNGKPVKGRNVRWKDIYYVTIYQLAKDGFTDRDICEAIGITQGTLIAWKKRRPALKEALNRARNRDIEDPDSGGVNFKEYVHDRLPEDLQELWEDIMILEDEPNSHYLIEEILKDKGKRARQYLFIHAFIKSNFVMSEACRQVNVSRYIVNSWIQRDLQFSRLFKEMWDAKKDFCESALMDLVKYREPSAVLFVNKTLNRDIYPTKLDVEHSGEIQHKHEMIDVEVLEELPLEVKKQILEAHRKHQETKRIEQHDPNILEVEAVEKTA